MNVYIRNFDQETIWREQIPLKTNSASSNQAGFYEWGPTIWQLVEFKKTAGIVDEGTYGVTGENLPHILARIDQRSK